jgi:hypothetical protein
MRNEIEIRTYAEILQKQLDDSTYRIYHNQIKEKLAVLLWVLQESENEKAKGGLL